MHFDYLIVGQGLCGTFLSWFLEKEKQSSLIIDNNYPNTPSRVAAGIINPITGRRLVRTWLIDEILPFTWETYNAIGNDLELPAISQQNIIDIFPSPDRRIAFIDRIDQGENYVHTFPDQNHYISHFKMDFGCGEIRPAYIAHLTSILPAYRKRLIDNNQLLEEEFEPNNLTIKKDHIIYKDIKATKIIFCDGIESFKTPFFNLLPFALNKGEALLLASEELPVTHTFKKNLLLAPLLEKGIFWVGSNYSWEFENDQPTELFRTTTTKQLENWIKVPFKIIDHKAAIRPATIERRPFVGLHPQNPQIGILNGMGTKGSSLAPWFANQLVRNLVHGSPIHPEADIARFKRILARQDIS